MALFLHISFLFDWSNITLIHLMAIVRRIVSSYHTGVAELTAGRELLMVGPLAQDGGRPSRLLFLPDLGGTAKANGQSPPRRDHETSLRKFQNSDDPCVLGLVNTGYQSFTSHRKISPVSVTTSN